MKKELGTIRKLLVSTLMVCILVGCGSKDIETQEDVEQEVQEAEPQQEDKQEVQEAEPKVEEPEIKKEQYDVVWGTYDKEWVYSDEWTGEGFKNFDEAMNVLDQCMKDSEEETEKCVYDYLRNK
jgi:hypothetical protein